MGKLFLGAKINKPRSKRSPKLKKWWIVMLDNEEGKIGWILLWALGIPLPIRLAADCFPAESRSLSGFQLRFLKRAG
jgi:hypothetical protein